MTCSLAFSRLALLALLAPVCALLLACDDSGTSRTEYSGVQSFCVEPVNGADGPALEVTVQVDTCLSSSCDTVIDSACGFTEVDGVLQLEAMATVESTGGTCTADCQAALATCMIPVEAGQTYVLRGDDGDEVELEAEAEDGACTTEPI